MVTGMFNSLFKRAEATVDNAIGQALNRLLVAIPFVIALGFATWALTVWAVREWGTETGLLAIAGGYAFIGVCMLPLLRRAPAAQTSEESAGETTEAVTTPEEKAADDAMNAEMAKSVLAAIAPIAAPSVIRFALRNLPMIAAIVGALIVYFRSQSAGGTPAPGEPVADLATPPTTVIPETAAAA
jgi:hypothetical protein